MFFPELIDLLKVSVSTPLREEEIDETLLHFRKMRPEITSPDKVKKSGVLLFFYPKDNHPHLLLIKRTTYKGAHSGQMGFPGGKMEPRDTSMVDTALREAQEEVAIQKPTIIGQLTDIYVPVSQFSITPVIGYLNERPEFIPEEREVAKLVELPAEVLLKDTLYKYGKIQVSKELWMNTYYFEADGHIVWGATAMIISELRSYLFRALKT